MTAFVVTTLVVASFTTFLAPALFGALTFRLAGALLFTAVFLLFAVFAAFLVFDADFFFATAILTSSK
jgi:hypothetical protein